MGKFLLLLGLLIAVYAFLRASRRRRRPPPAPRPMEAMARCAHCGVHFPSAEAVRDGEAQYCCEDHHQRGARW